MSEYKNSKIYQLTFNDYLVKVFSMVSIGLAITTAVSFVLAIFMETIIKTLGGLFMIVMLASCVGEIIIAIRLSSKLMELPKDKCWSLYIAYSVLTGISLSTLIYSYTTGTVWLAFGLTAIMFVVLTVIGNTTNINLSKFSGIALAGLIAIIITSLLNVFFKSAMMDWVICYAGIAIFMFITAMDVQKLRYFYEAGLNDNSLDDKLMVMGAFQLYLDFINLFIRILQLLGRSRRRE